jgi:hypothetical protein
MNFGIEIARGTYGSATAKWGRFSGEAPKIDEAIKNLLVKMRTAFDAYRQLSNSGLLSDEGRNEWRSLADVFLCEPQPPRDEDEV